MAVSYTHLIQAVKTEAGNLQLYSDPDSTELVNKLAETYNVSPEQVIVNNGSDETLNFAFMAFADEKHPLAFPDITYGFYPVFAELNHIPYSTIPLNGKLEINPDDFVGIGKTIVIANPNAPTGLSLTCLVYTSRDSSEYRRSFWCKPALQFQKLLPKSPCHFS